MPAAPRAPRTHARASAFLSEIVPDGVAVAELEGAIDAETAAWLCARHALAELGVSVEIGQHTMRWPEGATGCVAAAPRFAVAAAGARERFAGIGLHVGVIGVRRNDWDEWATPEERRFLAAQPASRRAPLAALMGSAKESFRRCLGAAGVAALPYHDLEVHLAGWDYECGAFAIRPAPPLAGPPPCGRFRFRDGLVLTAIALTDVPSVLAQHA